MNSTSSPGLEVAVTAWMLGTRGVADEFCQQAEIAEQLGFHSFWLPENHFGDEKSIPSPLTLLAAVAARTTKLKLGSTSYLITIRNPLQAAEEVAVLDRLSDGRLILGLGRGVQDAMFTAFDLPTKEKRKRFRTNLDIMRNAWQGNPVAEQADGKHIFLAPLPIQQPHPPLWMAAFGPLALKQAGSLAMPYLASPVETLATLEENYAHFHDMVAAHDHPPVTTVPVMRTVFVTGNPRRANEIRQALEAGPGHNMREPGSKVEDWTIIGDTKEVADSISEYRERLGMTHLIARGRLPGVDNADQVKSHEALVKLVADA